MIQYTEKAIQQTFQEMLTEMPFDKITVTELVKRANLYDEESGILTRWQAEPDGQHDIQDFFDEACDIIRNFHKRMGE